MQITIIDILIRLVLSVALSGVIGFEREHTKKPAGFRTHILVSIGSTTVMIASLLLFRDYNEFTTMDPSRLPAQVISGIGFLGAGTILREGLTVKGLTTAASIWAIGCIGLVVGSGYYELSIISTFIVFATLKLFGTIQHHFGDSEEHYSFYIMYNNQFQLDTLFEYINCVDSSLLSFNDSKGKAKFALEIKKHRDYMELLHKLSEDEDIDFVDTYLI